MDDLTPEVRRIVEVARTQHLSRAHKARLWARLEARVEERPKALPSRNTERPRFAVSSFARHALAGACLLVLALGAGGGVRSVDPSPAAPPVLAAAAPRPTAAVETPVAPAPVTAAPRVDGSLAMKRRSLPRRGLAPAATEAAPVTGVSGAVVALGEAMLEEEARSPRIQPARTRLLSAKTMAAAPRSPAPRVATEFRDKLIAENLARYQAGIAEHARTASIRRPLSSVGGYAAW